MKIKLNDNQELVVSSINRMLEKSNNKESISLIFPEEYKLEDISTTVTSENCSQITVIRDDKDNIVFSGFDVATISETIIDTTTTVMANLSKG